MKIICFIGCIIYTLTASIVAVFLNQKSDNYILFEHVGIIDKIIPAVAIAKEKSRFPSASTVPNYLYFKYTLNAVLYAKSEIIVLNAKKTKETDEFGNFKVIVVDGDKKTTCFVARKDAVALFSNLRALYTKEKVTTELPLMMDELKGRIYY